MAARLKIDENLPDEIADLFVRYGHDAVTVAEQGWRGMADRDLWQRIQDEGRWLVTADKELADAAIARQERMRALSSFGPAEKVWMHIWRLRKE